MPYDLTLQIMRADANHPVEKSLDAAAAYQQGDVIDVVPATRWATKQPNGQYQLFCNNGDNPFAYVHVTNVPDTMRPAQVKALLTESLNGYANVLETEQKMLRRRAISLVRGLAQPATVTALETDREITRPWKSLLGVMRRRAVSNAYDRSTDDLSTPVTEADFDNV